jgi:DNA-binding SARP family transcriptional activator/tetratricopeptide (TPR) repeat protein
MTELRIQLLGGFSVSIDGHPLEGATWQHRRAADLIKLLALSPNHRRSREQVINTLWPDLAGDAGGNNLRKAVYHARRALQREDALLLDAGYVILCPHWHISTDAAEFESAATLALDSTDRALCRTASHLFAGDLLPSDRYEPWVEPHADRLRNLFLGLLRTTEQWERLVSANPIDEQAHREVMKQHLREGRRAEAYLQFESLRKALREELGVGPDPATVRVYEEVLAREGPAAGDPAVHVNALIAQALGSLNRMELDQARDAAEEARRLAIGLEMGRAVGESSGILGMIAHMRGEWRARFREEFEDVIQGNPRLAPFVFDAHLCFAEFWLHGAEGSAAAARFARDLLAAGSDAESLPGRALATLMLAAAELLSGQLEDAESDVVTALRMHQEAGLRCGYIVCLERFADVDIARGHPAKASRSLTRAIGLAKRSPMCSHLLVRGWGGLVRAAGDPSKSKAIIDAGDRELAMHEICEPCSMTYRVAAAVASANTGDVERAERYLEDADRIAGMWRGGAWTAAVWEARARVRIACGEVRQGTALLDEAAGLFNRLGRPLDEARCRRSVSLRSRPRPQGNRSRH